MTGGLFYTVPIYATSRRLASRVDRLKPRDKAIRSFKQPELLLTGRVGTGKSRLLRHVVNHKTLSVANSHDGEIMRWYGVGRGKAVSSLRSNFIIVDSVGYNEIQGGVVKYLVSDRPGLKRIFLLIDSREGFHSFDEQMLQTLGSKRLTQNIVQPVITKADLVEPDKLRDVFNEISSATQQVLETVLPPIMTSTKKGMLVGVEEMRKSIAHAVHLPLEVAWKPRSNAFHLSWNQDVTWYTDIDALVKIAEKARIGQVLNESPEAAFQEAAEETLA